MVAWHVDERHATVTKFLGFIAVLRALASRPTAALPHHWKEFILEEVFIDAVDLGDETWLRAAAPRSGPVVRLPEGVRGRWGPRVAADASLPPDWKEFFSEEVFIGAVDHGMKHGSAQRAPRGAGLVVPPRGGWQRDGFRDGQSEPVRASSGCFAASST